MRNLIRQLMTSGRSTRWRSWRLLIWKRRRFAHLLYISIFLARSMLIIHSNLQAEKVIGEVEAKCDQKITECKEESRQYLIRVQEEHAALVCIKTYCKINIILLIIFSYIICIWLLVYDTNLSLISGCLLISIVNRFSYLTNDILQMLDDQGLISKI